MQLVLVCTEIARAQYMGEQARAQPQLLYIRIHMLCTRTPAAVIHAGMLAIANIQTHLYR